MRFCPPKRLSKPLPLASTAKLFRTLLLGHEQPAALSMFSRLHMPEHSVATARAWVSCHIELKKFGLQIFRYPVAAARVPATCTLNINQHLAEDIIKA